jgi:hypothetical protein
MSAERMEDMSEENVASMGGEGGKACFDHISRRKLRARGEGGMMGCDGRGWAGTTYATVSQGELDELSNADFRTEEVFATMVLVSKREKSVWLCRGRRRKVVLLFEGGAASCVSRRGLKHTRNPSPGFFCDGTGSTRTPLLPSRCLDPSGGDARCVSWQANATGAGPKGGEGNRAHLRASPRLVSSPLPSSGLIAPAVFPRLRPVICCHPNLGRGRRHCGPHFQWNTSRPQAEAAPL